MSHRTFLAYLSLFLICEVFILTQLSYQIVSEGWIADFGYETTRFKPGDSVSAWVIVRNNFDNVSIFYVGFSVRDPNDVWLDAPYTVLVLQPGAISEKVILSWKVPVDAATGFYAVKIAVWRGTAEGMLTERLDYLESNNAFYIIRELPPLAGIVNLSFSVLPNLVTYIASKRRKVKAYKLMGYNGIWCISYAIFLWNLPNALSSQIIFGYFFLIWGVSSIFVALNLEAFKKSQSRLNWTFDYKKPASIQMALFVYYFLLPIMWPEAPFSFSLLTSAVIGILSFFLLNYSTIAYCVLKDKRNSD